MTEPPQDDHATAVRRSPEGRIAVQMHLGLTERETKWVALDAPQGQLQVEILAPETVDQWEPLTGQAVTDAQSARGGPSVVQASPAYGSPPDPLLWPGRLGMGDGPCPAHGHHQTSPLLHRPQPGE